VQGYFIKEYDVETIYEFLSLGMAAFPYRFLFLSVDLPTIAAFLAGVKFVYKTIVYFMIYSPQFLKIKKKFS